MRPRIGGASKEATFRIRDAFHPVAQVGQAVVRKALFRLLVLLPRFLPGCLGRAHAHTTGVQMPRSS